MPFSKALLKASALLVILAAPASAARWLEKLPEGNFADKAEGYAGTYSPLNLKCNHNVVLCAYICWLFFRKCDFAGLFCVPL